MGGFLSGQAFEQQRAKVSFISHGPALDKLLIKLGERNDGAISADTEKQVCTGYLRLGLILVPR